MMSSSAEVARLVEAYDGLGWQRTGTEASRTSARWLAELASQAGAEVRLEPVTLERVVPGQCEVIIEGRAVPGLPLFDGGFTDTEGIDGRLGGIGSDANIWAIEYACWGGAGVGVKKQALRGMRRADTTRAIVMATLGPMPGLAANNAEHFGNPYGPVVLQVSSEHAEWLRRSVASGTQARVVASIERETTTDFNVVASYPGQDPSPAPVVVMTPRGGWWTVTAERVGGLICGLEMLHRACASTPRRGVRFIAGCGHELGHLGLRQHLDRLHDFQGAAAAWVHLGASIGAAVDPRLNLYASSADLQDLAAGCLKHQGAGPFGLPPIGRCGGESEQIQQRGGRFVSLMGSHGLVHLEADRWPQSVDPEALRRYAAGMGDLLSRLCETDGDADAIAAR